MGLLFSDEAFGFAEIGRPSVVRASTKAWQLARPTVANKMTIPMALRKNGGILVPVRS